MKNSYPWWVLGLVMASTAMAVLDTTIINVAMPAMMRELHATLLGVEWFATAYLIAMCVMLPTTGWLAARWGYKRLYIIGVLVFTIGSLACSLSDSLFSLIGWRVVQGLGSGMLQALGMALVTRAFSPEKRGVALGWWAVAAAASVSLGPFVGGWLLAHYSWHALFVPNVPIGLAVAAVAAVVMQEERKAQAGRFDLGGFLLLGLSSPLLVVGLALGASMGWDLWWVWGAIGVSLLLLGGYVRRYQRVKDPVLDLSVFKDRHFALSIVVLLLFGVGLFGGNYLLPIYMEHDLGYTALAAGLVFLPVGVIQGTLAVLSGSWGKRVGYKRLVVWGLGVFTLYFALSATFSSTTPEWFILLTLVLRGVGIGLAFTPLNTLAVSGLERDQMAAASGTANTVKQISGSFGIALFAALFSGGSGVGFSFLLAALFSLAGLLVVLFLPKR